MEKRTCSSPTRKSITVFRMICVLVALLACATLLSSCSRSLPAVQGAKAIPNGTSIDLSWEPVAGADGYVVFLDTTPDVSPSTYTQQFVETGVNATITDLTVGTSYYLIVVATSLYGFALGPASDVVAVTVTGSPSSAGPVITAISANPATAAENGVSSLTYTWLVNGSIVAGPTADLNQYTWTPSTAGSYTVEVQVTDGTTTVSAATDVTVRATP